jgi:hypothetical protein
MAEKKLKYEDFQYPTKKEYERIRKKISNLQNFNFNYTPVMTLILKERMPLNDASRFNNLNNWDYCLINRLAMVRDSYLYAFTNFHRGFNDDYHKCSDIQSVNHMLFDYYAEIFYYYYFSTRDIIAQILRTYYSIEIKEDKLYFNIMFINKIKDARVKSIIIKFVDSTRDTNDFRNGFTHRYTPNLPDYRSVIIEDNMKMNFGGGHYIESKKIVENIDKSLNSLSDFLIELKQFIN